MRIGIIGAGHIGGTLTRRFRAVGHEVSVANSRGPETLAELARETGATATTIEDAVKNVDLIVVTIPEAKISQLPSGLLAQVGSEVAVVDTGNYYPKRDGYIADIEDGLCESQWVERQLGHPVVKAFNNIYALHLLEKGLAHGTPGRIALPVAGDDIAAKKMVLDLADQIGFDAVDAGGLGESWRQQPGSPVYASDFDADGVRQALASASSQRLPEFRAQASTGA